MDFHKIATLNYIIQFIFAVLFVMTYNSGFCATIHVPGALTTIQEALNVANEGDTILVADGTYTGAENRNLDFLGKAIVLTSENGALKTVIDCQLSGRGLYFNNMEDSMTIVDGLTIKNAMVDQTRNGAGVYTGEGACPVLKNLIIVNNIARQKYHYDFCGKGGGIFCETHSSPLIIGCEIKKNTGEGGGGGIFCSESSHARILNCLIENNTSPIYLPDSGGGIQCYRCSAVIYNCVFRGNSGCGAGELFLDQDKSTIRYCLFTGQKEIESGSAINCNESSSTITHCTLTALRGSGIKIHGGNLVVESSIIWGNGRSEISLSQNRGAMISYCNIGDLGFPGPGNISENPRFCEPSAGDFTLHETSPCLGTGKGGTDMGAFGVGCERGKPGRCLKVPEEYPGIKQALEAAYFYGDTILVAPGIYGGESNTDLNTWGKAVFLKSEQGAKETVIDCKADSTGTHYGFLITSNEDSTTIIQGFKIQNAEYDWFGAGIGIWDSSPLIKDCILDNNYSHADGGAVSLVNSSSKIYDCEMTGNNADGFGGGLYIEDAFKPEIKFCRFETNSSAYGGAISIRHSFSPEISQCVLQGNSSEYGGMYSGGSSTVIRNTLFLENVRKGLFTEGDNTLIENCIFFNQNGWYAVFDFYSRLLFSGCTIVGNQGYGISGYDSDIEIINSILWGNAFDELGVYSGNIAVTYSDIDDGGWEGEGNISESPLFCAPASLNFSLHETSPCVHSGKGGDHMGARGIGCRGGAPGKVHRVPEEYGTILEAIKQCYFYGDTVLVSPGTYAGKGNTNINLFEKQIVIKSEKGSDSTLILCRSEGVDKEYSRAFCALSGIDTSSIIQGFTIRNGYHGEGGAIALYDASPSILDCVFAGDTAIYSGGAIYCTGSPVISGCKFYDNLSTQGGGGIYFYEKANASPRIHESLFFNNVTTDLWGGAITIDPFSSPTQLTMSNCTIASNHASYSGGLSCFKFPVKVINSIFWDNTPDQISGSASVTYSDIKGGWTGQGNINSDPFFVNVKEQDFRLRSVSSCIDAGDLSFPNVPWGGSRRDMGALEYDQGWYLDREGRFIRKPIARNRNLIYPERD